jgi:transposase
VLTKGSNHAKACYISGMTAEVPTENPANLEDAIAIIKFLSEALTNEREENDALKHRLQLMLRHRFGQRSEKFSPGQLLLDFPGMKEALAAAGIDESELTPAPKVEIEDKPEREGHGRRKLPEDLPRKEIEHDLPENEKTCEVCGDELDKIGEETSEQLEYIPGHFEVLQHKRFKYACKNKNCECTIKLAAKPETSIWKCMAGPGLLAHTLISKFDDHLPFYRQAEIIERLAGR